MIWFNAKTNPPVLAIDVLLAVEGQTQAAEGFRSAPRKYIYSTGHDVEGHVFAWAHLPACPDAATLKPLRVRSVPVRREQKGGRG